MRMNRVPNTWIRELWEWQRWWMIVFRWFGYTERIWITGNDLGNDLVGWPQRRWIDPENDCFKKGGLDVGQARRMVHGRNEWRGLWGGGLGHSPTDGHLTLKRCRSCWLSQLNESCGVAFLRPNLPPVVQRRNIFFSSIVLFSYLSFHGMMHADPPVEGGGDV